MATITINIPDEATAKLSAIVKEMGGEIVMPKKNTTKLSVQKEADLLNQIETGLKDVADIQAGKIARVSLSEGLRG